MGVRHPQHRIVGRLRKRIAAKISQVDETLRLDTVPGTLWRYYAKPALKRAGTQGENQKYHERSLFEAAINGQADVLVTYNLADFVGVAERFRISVMHPADLLKKVKIR